MRRKENGRKKKKGALYAEASFTVEASALMTIILPVLIVILLAGFYLHDSAYLQMTATELCAMGSNMKVYKESAADPESVKNTRLRHSLIWIRGASGTVSSGEDTVSAQLSGSFAVPGLAGRLMGFAKMQITKTWSRRLYRPSEMIWKIRAAKYLADAAL